MIMKNKIFGAVIYVSLLIFFIFAAYILYINQEVLYTAQDRSEYIYGSPFFVSLLSKPFGLTQYVGAWLTQLFYKPVLGAAVLMTIWVLIFLVGTKAFRLEGNAKALMLLPLSCLLASIVDLGYWIYIFTIRGYWFSQSIGLLAMLLLLWTARCTARKWHLIWYLTGFCLYPVLGWFAWLFILCLVLTEKPSWPEILAVVLCIFSASTWRILLYSNQNFDELLWAGFPHFVTPVEESLHLSLPFWFLGAFTLIIPILNRFVQQWFIPALCTLAGLSLTLSLMYSDKNYIDEMRMVRYASDDNWKGVLNVASENSSPSHTMVLLKNIALMNDGDLLDRSFMLGNNGIPVYAPDSIHISVLNIASPLICYNYGMINEAIRLSYENAVPTGFSPFYMKMISRCAKATGEKDLEERFTHLLHCNMFYKDWQAAPTNTATELLHQSFKDELYGVENNCERYVIDNLSALSDSTNKVVSEQALFYSMMRRDSQRFWSSLRNYVKSHKDGIFPRHAMEAYIMYMDKAPEKKRIMLPVEQEVYDRYKKFWTTLEGHFKSGMATQDIPEKMRGEFGDTYWYYNVFATNLY